MIKLARIYQSPSSDKGYRVLVDRLWPRGISKKEAQLDLWLKEIAPSDDLRKWFDHDPQKWEEFAKRYREELAERSDELKELVSKAKDTSVILLYAAKDEEHNNAVVLKEYIEEKL